MCPAVELKLFDYSLFGVLHLQNNYRLYSQNKIVIKVNKLACLIKAAASMNLHINEFWVLYVRDNYHSLFQLCSTRRHTLNVHYFA